MIAVCGPEELLAELPEFNDQVHIISKDEINTNKEKVLLYLYEDGHQVQFSKYQIVLINAVCETLSAHHLSENILRMNGWKSFIHRTAWEIAGKINDDLLDATSSIGKKLIPVKDEPGFIAGRVLAMIINEAWFAREDNISTEKEIDIAMKLGTGYPYGPFEWTNIIGAQHIIDLLNVLAATDARYQPCEFLKKAARG